MPNRNYERGARAEYRAKRILEKQGFFVIRSAGSHGPVDLIAVGATSILMLQVKSEEEPGDYTADIKRLGEVVIPENGRRQLWIWNMTRRWWDKVEVGRR